MKTLNGTELTFIHFFKNCKNNSEKHITVGTVKEIKEGSRKVLKCWIKYQSSHAEIVKSESKKKRQIWTHGGNMSNSKIIIGV